MRRGRSAEVPTPFRRSVGSLLPWPATVAGALLLAACGGSVAPSASAASPGTTPTVSALGAASAGLCVAERALPDVASAETTFVNQAHDALHALAAAPDLDRATAARVLEAMDVVEQDFDGSAAPASLADALASLRSAADHALTALGIDIPGCVR